LDKVQIFQKFKGVKKSVQDRVEYREWLQNVGFIALFRNLRGFFDSFFEALNKFLE